MSEADKSRYQKALHAVQSGIAAMMGAVSTGAIDRFAAVETKHMRVGIDSAHISNAALVRLLIAKGVFTLDEFEKELADEAEREVQLNIKRLKQVYPNVDISLG